MSARLVAGLSRAWPASYKSYLLTSNFSLKPNQMRARVLSVPEIDLVPVPCIFSMFMFLVRARLFSCRDWHRVSVPTYFPYEGVSSREGVMND